MKSCNIVISECIACSIENLSRSTAQQLPVPAFDPALTRPVCIPFFADSISTTLQFTNCTRHFLATFVHISNQLSLTALQSTV